MKKRGLVTILLLCSFLTAVSQTFPEFDSLRKKADDAYHEKNYELTLSLFEALLSLPANKTPELNGSFYYDVSCAYSLNQRTDKSFEYLNKSFYLARQTKGTTPVSINHIASDTDLDFIRNDSRFDALVRKYYSAKDVVKFQKRTAFNKLKEVSYQELLEFIQSPEGSLEIKDKIIYWRKEGDSLIYNNSALDIPKIDRLKTDEIEFINCTFRLNFVWNMNDVENGQLHPFYRIRFYKCHFEGRFSMNEILIKGKGGLVFVECIFDKTFLLMPRFDIEETWGGCAIAKCTFHLGYAYINSSAPMGFEFVDNQLLENMHLNAKLINRAVITGNQSETGMLSMWMIDTEVLKINKNKVPLMNIRGEIETEFDFEKNEISKNVIFTNTIFPETVANDIDWSTLNQGRLALIAINGEGGVQWKTNEGFLRETGDDPRNQKLLTGKLDEDISDESNFRYLMGLYSMFLNLYKSKSDIESYNACFVDIKELQSKRLEYLYQSRKTFESYFSWKLSQLLKFYVVHGTKPARAIVISIYIIFWFGVFFFFFPSDWDVTSKGKLIQNFKDFVQKNEKGYIKPFFILVWGFLVSMLNALTLSLNAFITLGFGNIPTHGIARYVCVLEGFLGWFLLSIFTVALINQVL